MMISPQRCIMPAEQWPDILYKLMMTSATFTKMLQFNGNFIKYLSNFTQNIRKVGLCPLKGPLAISYITYNIVNVFTLTF